MKLQRLIGIRVCKARLNITLRLYSVGMRYCLIRTLNDSFDIIPNLPSEAMSRSPPSFTHITAVQVFISHYPLPARSSSCYIRNLWNETPCSSIKKPARKCYHPQSHFQEPISKDTLPKIQNDRCTKLFVTTL